MGKNIMENQNIAIVGLNEAGQKMLHKMLALKDRGVNVVGVATQHQKSDIDTADQAGLDVLTIQQLVDVGEKVDIIFDLSGNRAVRSELRRTLFSSNNQHTVIAPESVARLVCAMIGDGCELPTSEQPGY